MTDPTARDLIQRLADSVELLLLMRNGLTPLVITEAALDEARAYLAQPEPEVPTDENWDALVDRLWGKYETIGYQGERFMYEGDFSTALDLVRQEIARWGNPAPAPPADGEVAELTGQLIEAANGAAAMGWNQHAQRILRAAELLQRQALVPVAVSERLPEANTKVLAHYVNDLGKGRTICAIWVPAKTRSDEGGHDDFTEYDEEDDKFYWPEGWYEAIENWDELGYVQVYEGEVDYWQPLPKWPARSLPLPAATDCPRIDSWRPHATPRLHPLHGGDAPVPPAGPLRSIP